MISDVKCGKYEGKGLPQEFGKRAVKGEFAARGKAQSIGTLGFSEKIGSFLPTSPHSTKFGSYVTTLIEGLNYGMTTIIRALQ